uniref:Cytohesin Ubiquitin Protein Inducing domain-containing protein n=1 Tax=Anopheles coluzzii TaxID=1518534 RepID=A0A8W7PDP6_ANOCL
MGDAKVKQQPFFGNQTHQHQHHHHHQHTAVTPHETTTPIASTSKANGTATATMGTVVMDAKHATGALLGSPQQQPPGKEAMVGTTTTNTNTSTTGTPVAGKDKSPASQKYEQLKLRKQELEKRLNEKYSQLQQIKREEAQLIGMYPSDFSCGIGPSGSTDGVNGTAGSGGTGGAMGTGNGTAPTLRRKIGTSFKLPENLLNNKEDDINKLLLEKQIQQQISEAMLRHRARTDSFPGIATSYDTVSAGSGATEQSLKVSPLSGSGSIASGGSGAQQPHPHLHPHHHHSIGPGPARMNRLIQQQLGANNYSPPAAGSGTPGYVLSPTAGGNGQAFVYDAKVISRLQGGSNGAGMNSNPRSPQASAPSAAYGHAINDQNYCPNAMAAGAGQSGAAYEYTAQPEQPTSAVPAGLGGYWMTLENGEKVWCSVDNRQFSSLDRKQQGGSSGGSMKLSRTSTKLNGNNKPAGQFGAAVTPAVKSSSLGNFQEYIGKTSPLDDADMMTVQPDAISVTSGSSEHKKREKVWRETSLDSPVVKHKALPPVPTSPAGQMSPSSIGSGQLLHSPHGAIPQSPPYPVPPMVGGNPPTAPLHINTNVSGYGAGPCSPLLLSPQQMRYYQQRQQQLLEQQRQKIKHLQQQQQQHQQHQRLMMEEQQKQQQFLASSKQQHESMPSPQSPMGSIGATSSTATTGEPYGSSPYAYQQTPLDPQSVPPYHSRHQHPPPPPLPPPNQHHYHHSQQLHNRLQHSPSVPSPQHLDLLPQSYSQQQQQQLSDHHSPSLGHHGRGQQQYQVHADSGYYPHAAGHLANTLSSRHPDLVISPTLSQASSHTLTSPTATTVVQALPVVGGAEDNSGFSGPSSPTPSSGSKGPAAPPSDIQMESPKNMTVVQQGKIMPYKEVTKPFEMSDFYKYSTKYRQKQQQPATAAATSTAAAATISVGRVWPGGDGK